MKIQVLSDLHLELNPCKISFVQGCDGLILAGDIGCPSSAEYKALLQEASASFEWVVVIRGNHECYGYKSIIHAGDKIGQVCALFPNVHYLQKKSLDVGRDIRIIGVTLWSEILDDHRSEIGWLISDFSQINKWTIENHNFQHSRDLKFIQIEIERAKHDKKRLIVVSHHAPSKKNTSSKKHLGCPLSSAYSTELDHLFQDPVIAWIYGHTHHSNDQIINGVRLISNQKGYGDEDTGYDPMFCFVIED